jgi:CPA2 family monovalent cation:H+ antiporter-2
MNIFTDLAFIFLISIVILIICHRFKVPSIIGFLLAGVIAGPAGFGLVHNTANIEFLAEIGVILLLFVIGMEMSIDKLMKSKRMLFVGGGVQVLSTIAIVSALVFLFGYNWQLALFAGFLVSFSSTAVDLKILQERKEIDTPHGHSALSIHIFQDLALIPMMLVTPYLIGDSTSSAASAIGALLVGIIIIVIVYFTSRNVVPTLLYKAARIKDQELFVYIVLATCMLIAYLSELIGLSLALGAFLAGLIVAESEYSTHALYNILPFKDIFMSFFFVSTGMMFSIAVMFEHIYVPAIGPVVGFIFIIALVIGAVLIKLFTGMLGALLGGGSAQVVIKAGFHLSFMSEFTLILATIGYSASLLTNAMYQVVLAVTIISMAIGPFLINFSDAIAPGLGRRLSKSLRVKYNDADMKCDDIKDHIIIAGYGLCGRNVAHSANLAHIPYRIVELNPDTVQKERAKGVPILYGDAGQAEVLVHAGIMAARVCVIVIDNLFATQQAVRMARELNPAVHIMARTRFLGEVPNLIENGAHEVISEELETSVEMFSRILHTYLTPRDEIQKITSEIRSGNYDMYRNLQKVPYTIADVESMQDGMDMETIRISASSPYCGVMLKDTALRAQHNLTIVAIKRGKLVIPVPAGDEIILAGDIVMVFGKPEDVINAFPSESDEDISGCAVIIPPPEEVLLEEKPSEEILPEESSGDQPHLIVDDERPPEEIPPEESSGR